MARSPGITGDASPGWFGKLPCIGDFASRRMAPLTRDAWDQWLSGVLVETREHWADQWLTHYLQAPIWFWLQSPGEHTTQWSAGTLMPSVDQAGRYFPLVIVQPLQRAPVDVCDWQQLEEALRGFAATSLAALASPSSLEYFDKQLTTAPMAPIATSVTVPSPASTITSWLLAECTSQLAGASLWWIDQRDGARIEQRWPQDGSFLLRA